MNPSNCLHKQWWRRCFLLEKEKFLWLSIIPAESTSTRKFVACKNSHFSSLVDAGDVLHFVSSMQDIPSRKEQGEMAVSVGYHFSCLLGKYMWTLLFQISCAGLPTFPLLLTLTLYSFGKCCLPVNNTSDWLHHYPGAILYQHNIL